MGLEKSTKEIMEEFDNKGFEFIKGTYIKGTVCEDTPDYIPTEDEIRATFKNDYDEVKIVKAPRLMQTLSNASYVYIVGKFW